jgi:hypothetical protein
LVLGLVHHVLETGEVDVVEVQVHGCGLSGRGGEKRGEAGECLNASVVRHRPPMEGTDSEEMRQANKNASCNARMQYELSCVKEG